MQKGRSGFDSKVFATAVGEKILKGNTKVSCSDSCVVQTELADAGAEMCCGSRSCMRLVSIGLSTLQWGASRTS